MPSYQRLSFHCLKQLDTAYSLRKGSFNATLDRDAMTLELRPYYSDITEDVA